MDPTDPEDSAFTGESNASGSGSAPSTKRTRVLLSCGPCRASKLKCDRAQPCTRCLKKARPTDCVYTPKPDKKRPAKGMAARLKRLEGMVRGMMDEGGEFPSAVAAASSSREIERVGPQGQVAIGESGTTYIGATHFMAILEDVRTNSIYVLSLIRCLKMIWGMWGCTCNGEGDCAR